jgi:hypothetical protein
MSSTAQHTHTVKGPGLARGPAMIVGTILSVAGLALFLHAGDTSTAGFPDGEVAGTSLLGFESNGWTAWITTAAGALLLFGAAQHLLAKAMSAIVGVALAACAVIALIDGDVLGLAAANWAVELGWGIAAVILLLNLLAPRVKHEEPVVPVDRHRDHDRGADHDRHAAPDHDHHDRRDRAVSDAPEPERHVSHDSDRGEPVHGHVVGRDASGRTVIDNDDRRTGDRSVSDAGVGDQDPTRARDPRAGTDR